MCHICYNISSNVCLNVSTWSGNDSPSYLQSRDWTPPDTIRFPLNGTYYSAGKWNATHHSVTQCVKGYIAEVADIVFFGLVVSSLAIHDSHIWATRVILKHQ